MALGGVARADVVRDVTKRAMATRALFHSVAELIRGSANALMNSHTDRIVLRNRSLGTFTAPRANTKARTPEIQVFVR
jgi:hypothetical protein